MKRHQFTCCLKWSAICHDTIKSPKSVFIVWVSLKIDKIWMLTLCFIPNITCSVLSVGALSVSSLISDVFSTEWEHVWRESAWLVGHSNSNTSCIHTSSDFCCCMWPGAGDEVASGRSHYWLPWQQIRFLAATYKHFGGKILNII